MTLSCVQTVQRVKAWGLLPFKWAARPHNHPWEGLHPPKVQLVGSTPLYKGV